jgi:Mob1/phocein family
VVVAGAVVLPHGLTLPRSHTTSQSLNPVLPAAITQRYRPEFEMLRRHLNSVFAADGAPRQMAKAVKVPPKEKKMPWLSVGLAHTFRWVVSCFNLVAGECTDASCPTMMASPKIHYTWADGVKVRTPIECPAPQYVHYLFEWTREQLENPEILPLEGVYERQGVCFSPSGGLAAHSRSCSHSFSCLFLFCLVVLLLSFLGLPSPWPAGTLLQATLFRGSPCVCRGFSLLSWS